MRIEQSHILQSEPTIPEIPSLLEDQETALNKAVKAVQERADKLTEQNLEKELFLQCFESAYKRTFLGDTTMENLQTMNPFLFARLKEKYSPEIIGTFYDSKRPALDLTDVSKLQF